MTLFITTELEIFVFSPILQFFPTIDLDITVFYYNSTPSAINESIC